MMKKWISLPILLCLMIITILTGAVPAEAKTTGTVRVGWFNSPFYRYDEANRRTGYAYEYQQKISAYTGWKYDYIKKGWYSLLQDIKSGNLDLLADVSKTKEREKEMLFSDYPMGTEVYYLIITSTNKTIHANDISSLNGKTIGITNGSIQESQFYQWAKKQGIHAKVKLLNGSDQENMALLKENKIDAYLGVGGLEEYLDDAVPTFMIGSSDFYFAINKNRPDLKKEIDQAMMSIISTNWYYNHELADKYLTRSGAQRFLGSDELTWLKEHGAIRIGYYDHFLPFCQYDPEKKDVTGLLQDFIAEAKDSMKNARLTFKTVPFKRQSDMNRALKNGEIDCIFPSSVSIAQAEALGIHQTDPLVKADTLAVVQKNKVSSFDISKNHSVAISDTADTTTIVSGYFPHWEQKRYSSPDALLNAVTRGDADCVLMSSYQAFVQHSDIESRHLTTIATGVTPPITFGVRRDLKSLYSILTKLTKAIPDTSINTALTKYTTPSQNVTFTAYVKDNLFTVLGFLTAILLIILALLLRSLKTIKNTRKLNLALVEAEQKAAEASKAKSFFLFNMSHDIRTPMNAIIGYTEMAIRRKHDEDLVSDCLNKIIRASEQLLHLINDVLDMSQIESGKTEILLQPMSITYTMDNLKNIFLAQANAKHIQLEIKEVSVQHDTVLTDLKMVNRILMNLISNALKFTPEDGKVSISAIEMEPVSSDCSTYRLIVEDNGIGMSQDFLKRIFEPFERERTSTVSRQQGTGLGMAIVSTITKLLNGQISIDSTVGEGSRFTIDLPLTFSNETAVNLPSSKASIMSSFPGKHILLVEDMAINMELAKAILEEMDLTVDTAENGQIAVDMFRENPTRYDAILMDIQMPVMNGYEATKAIRSLAVPCASSIPIIAMTANAFASDRNQAFAAGMNDHVAKPIDLAQLSKTLQHYLIEK